MSNKREFGDLEELSRSDISISFPFFHSAAAGMERKEESRNKLDETRKKGKKERGTIIGNTREQQEEEKKRKTGKGKNAGKSLQLSFLCLI